MRGALALAPLVEVQMNTDIACLHCGNLFAARRGKKYCSFECGAHSKKHGLTETVEWKTWARIRRRCNSPKYHNYPRDGARGIKVCDRWDDFANFLSDMGPRPEGMTLDRIDNDGNYEPANCRWATPTQQSRNRGAYNYSAAEDQKIRDAIALGYNFRQVAEYVGLPRGSVTARAYRMGLKSGTPPIPKKDRGSPHPSQERKSP
jgi:hypothetical protein